MSSTFSLAQESLCVTRAHGLDPQPVSKLESWLMAHFEATLMLTTNNHFKTLFRAICGFTGPKTPKIRPKKGLKSARRPKFGNKIGTQGPRDLVLVPNERSP